VFTFEGTHYCDPPPFELHRAGSGGTNGIADHQPNDHLGPYQPFFLEMAFFDAHFGMPARSEPSPNPVAAVQLRKTESVLRGTMATGLKRPILRSLVPPLSSIGRYRVGDSATCR
jgi:hypothetical protein